MALKEYAGNAPATRLSGSLASGTTTSFAVITGGGTGYPAGATAPFVVVIDRGTATEEKILVASRAGDTFSTLTRGYDGTTAQAHAAQAVVEHVFDAVSASEFSQHTSNVPADPHTQYQTEAGLAAAVSALGYALPAAVPFVIPHTWAVGADVRVPSGDTDYLPPMFVPLPAGYAVTLTRARHRINSGTSATVKLQKDGVDITGWTGISVTTTSTTTDAADSTFTDGQTLALVVTAVVGTPRNMTFTVYLEYKKL